MKPIHPQELVQQAVQATEGLFTSQPDLEFIQEIPEDLPLVKADKDRILQVLINLISNAVKFTEKGYVKIGVEPINDITGSQDNRITIYIEDTGAGIPKSHVNKIFEKFIQVDDHQAGRPKGTGLGLPICKEIVEHHGGKIWVESNEKGSRFSFTLTVS